MVMAPDDRWENPGAVSPEAGPDSDQYHDDAYGPAWSGKGEDLYASGALGGTFDEY